MAMEFLFWKMKKSWRWIVVMVTQQSNVLNASGLNLH